MRSLPPDSARLQWSLGCLLFVGTLLLFAPALANDFVNYDDPDYVTANPTVKNGLTFESIRWAFTVQHASNWHPVTWLSHLLDVSLFGLNPRGHHATSVLLHATNAVLAFGALRALTGAVWSSVFCAALFAWHPLRVESVAWVAERKDVLSGLFFFAALWAYGTYVRRRTAKSPRAAMAYGLCLGLFAVGLLAKPMLVTFPCVLLLLDAWPLRRLTPASWRPRLAEKLPFFALAAISSFVTYGAQKNGGAVSMALSMEQRWSNAVVSVVRYVGKFLAPADLAVLYPHPGDWPTRKIVACAVIVALISALAWLARRRMPWLGIGWLWFLGMLVPVVGLVQVGLQSMADRYTYLPIVGLQVAVIWSLAEVKTLSQTVRLAAAALTLLVSALLTWRQIGVWRNSFTLFDHAIARTEGNYLAHNNRAIWLADAGRGAEAVADYERALKIRPDYAETNNNLGRMYVQQGRPADAVPLLRRAFAGKPGSLEVRNNLANALSDVGALAEARTHYEEILRVDPRHANALNGLGVVLAMQGQPAEARVRIEESLRLSPDNPAAHNNLGNVGAMLKDFDLAARHYRRAATLQPDAHTFAQLGFALSQLGNRDGALEALRTALQLRPDHAEAKAWLAQLSAPQPAAR